MNERIVDIKIPRYHVLEEIAEGAHSKILKARDEHGEVVAIKRVVGDTPEARKAIGHVRSEFRVLRKLEKNNGKRQPHPNIVCVRELIQSGRFLGPPVCNLVMEFIPGKRLDECGDLPLAVMMDLFLQVAKALCYVHSHGIIHADVKPQNILVIASESKAKLIDFGLTCKMGKRPRSIRGTREYMAIEQIRQEPLDERTDIYGFGAVMYRMLAGENLPSMLPTSNTDGHFIDGSHLRPPHVSKVNPDVPKPIGDVVMRCCRRHQRKRPKNMIEVVRMLEEAMKAR